MTFLWNLYPCLITFQMSNFCTAHKEDSLTDSFFAEWAQYCYICKSRLGVPNEFSVTWMYNNCILVRISFQNQQAFLWKDIFWMTYFIWFRMELWWMLKKIMLIEFVVTIVYKVWFISRNISWFRNKFRYCTYRTIEASLKCL